MPLLRLWVEVDYKVESAFNGFEKAITIQPLLIICDIMMPEMDGFEVKEILNENNLISNIPFTFLTAIADRSGLSRGKELAVNDYIIKPFTFVDLLSVINRRIKLFKIIIYPPKIKC